MGIRERVSVEEFSEIAKENDFFLWHFLQKNQVDNTLSFFSYFDNPPSESRIHTLKYILDNIEIPYFESYTEESIDFLIDLGFDGKKLFEPRPTPNYFVPREHFFKPILISFQKYKIVKSTNEVCYCPEGLFEILMDTNPNIILKSKFV